MGVIDELLARAEREFELARRRREMAFAIAADWAWWGPALNAATEPVDALEGIDRPTAPTEVAAPVLTAATPALGACRQCGEAIPPRSRGKGGRQKIFCSAECRTKHHSARQAQKRNGAIRSRKIKVELGPEPVPDFNSGARPLRVPDYEAPEVAQALALQKMPWERH
jgi:hypothetical protein